MGFFLVSIALGSLLGGLVVGWLLMAWELFPPPPERPARLPLAKAIGSRANCKRCWGYGLRWIETRHGLYRAPCGCASKSAPGPKPTNPAYDGLMKALNLR